MTTLRDPAADADEVQAALHALAQATRSIDDPRQSYLVLGSLTSAVASMSQALHQVASFHDGSANAGAGPAGASQAGRAAAYQVSWELHRAGEILHQVAESIDRAHEVQATIVHDLGDLPAVRESEHPSLDHGIGL